MKLKTSVHPVQTKQAMDVKQAEIQNLKAEVKELKSIVAAVVTKPCETKEEYFDTVPATTARTCEKHQDSDLTALKKQVKRLQQKLNNKVTASDAPDNPTAVSTVEATTRAANSPIRTVRRPEEHFCYRCGENGHFAAKCHNQENQSKVIKKLIQALRLSKETQSSTSAAEAEVNCAVKRSLVMAPQSTAIPEGLIGPPSVVPLKVNGHPCDALFDNGSQVTIIFESWYQEHLADVLIHPVAGLDLWGLSDSEAGYPYRGYIVVELEYSAEVIGTCHTETVLALICPTPRTGEQIPVLVGTNTSHVRNLVKHCKKSGVDITRTLGIRADSVDEVATNDSASPNDVQDDDVGFLTWQGPGPLILPPGKDTEVVCKVGFTQPFGKEILMVDSSPSDPLPGSVLLQPMVVPGPAVNVNNFRILVQLSSKRQLYQWEPSWDTCT